MKSNVPFERIQKLFLRLISHDDVFVSKGLALGGVLSDKRLVRNGGK